MQSGNRALHRAAAYGHAGVIRVLMAAGADPDVQNNEGATPLSRAARWCHEDAARMLLQVRIANIITILRLFDHECRIMALVLATVRRFTLAMMNRNDRLVLPPTASIGCSAAQIATWLTTTIARRWIGPRQKGTTSWF